jgi:hypothetical protein
MERRGITIHDYCSSAALLPLRTVLYVAMHYNIVLDWLHARLLVRQMTNAGKSAGIARSAVGCCVLRAACHTRY